MIKNNQNLLVGWSLSIGKIRKNLRTNQQSSLKRYVKCALQSENKQNQYRPSASFTSMSKKLKKPWGQGWVETKLLELKHWLDKKIRQMKKSKDFSLLWKLANKNLAIFFVWSVTTLSCLPNSAASGVFIAFPQITEKILITNTCHWLEPITIILGFLKIFKFRETITHFRTIICSQCPIFHFSSPILMPIISWCENSSCV